MGDAESEHSLAVPFVTVASVGGPHDDASYVAGAEMAQLEVDLRIAQAVNAVPCPRYVRTENVPQVDLFAMHHGFTLTAITPWDEHEDEWTEVSFVNARGLTCCPAPIEGDTP